jgi:hypothetical protein
MTAWPADASEIATIVATVAALTSPLFGIMFLLPWGALLLSAPLILVVLVLWFRSAG